MKVLTAAQMQEADRSTIEDLAIPGVVLMENAGRLVAEAIVDRYRERLAAGVLIVAGRGNNGGDGYVIARHLHHAGWPVRTLVLAADRGRITGDAAVNLEVLERCGGDLAFVDSMELFVSAVAGWDGCALLVDAIFGTGLTKPVTCLQAEVIAWLNQNAAPVVAVDLPSGIDASSGRVLGCCVKADLTVTFALPKIGLVSYPGAGYVGELRVVDIGIPPQVTDGAVAECLLVDRGEAANMLPPRPRDGHKGTFGHLLVVAGSLGKSGAAVMVAESALRGGAGLVTLACPASIQPIVAGQRVEIMTVPLPDCGGELSAQAPPLVRALLANRQALALGPGLGVGSACASLVRELVTDCDLPMVIDADGLNALVGHLELLQRRSAIDTVLTPHPGEMSRLTGLTTTEVQQNRFAIAREFALHHGVTLVLKGARTLTATPAGRVFVNQSGHTGLATGGMGDVLTGLIGSLLAQGLPAETAAPLGVFLHGLAADCLAPRYGDAGLLAGDLMDELPAARLALKKEQR